MPFTPIHMGPGLAFKAIGGHRLSLMVFGFTQVMIDIEPLVRILRGDDLLHGFTHTYLGATLIALVSTVLGRPICQWLLEYWRPAPRTFWAWVRGPERISWTAASGGAFVGAYSHVLFDSIMHYDMHPLAPWSQSKALLHVIPVDTLHALCVASGALGAVALMVALVRRMRRGDFADLP